MTKQNNKKKEDELLLLYSACVSEIDSFKKQQWQVTNYGLLLYAVIVSIPKLINALSQIEYFVLFVMAAIVALSGWHLVTLLSSSIEWRRMRITETRKHFSEEFMGAWRCGKSVTDVPDNPEDKIQLLWFFRAVFLSGFAVVCWLLVRFACAI